MANAPFTDEVLEAGRLFFAAGIILPQRLRLRLRLWLRLRLRLQLSRAVRLAAARGVLRRPLLALAPLRPRPSRHWLSGSSAPPSSVAPPHPQWRPFGPLRTERSRRPFASANPV